jgi:hypothetical protein
MHTGAEAAVEFLESAFRGTREFQPISKLQDDWRGAPEFLAQAAVRLGALVGATGNGERTLFVDTAGLDAARTRAAAKPAAIAPAAAPTGATPRASAPSAQLKASAPAVTPPKEPTMTYTNAELRTRVSAIFGSSASRGAEALALQLVGASGITTDAAIQSLRIAKGEATYSPATATKIDVAAIYKARETSMERYRRYHAQHEATATHPTANAPLFRGSGAALNPAEIYARRNAQSGHHVAGVGMNGAAAASPGEARGIKSTAERYARYRAEHAASATHPLANSPASPAHNTINPAERG